MSITNELSDSYLAMRVASMGDRRAFDMLVRRHQSRVRRFFLAQTLGNGPLSDDLAQDTFIRAWTGVSRFKGLSSFATWLMAIAYRVLLDHAKSHHPTLDMTEAMAAKTPAPEPAGALRHDLYKALATLRHDERACICLQLIDGLPIDKIAAVTGLPSGTVKSHLKRGKDKMAEYLKENGY